jgi:hypothetical protein
MRERGFLLTLSAHHPASATLLPFAWYALTGNEDTVIRLGVTIL